METRLHCPACDSDSVALIESKYDVDHFGSVLLNVSTCQKCGYRHTDVTTLTTHDPVALTAKIRSLEDLNMRVIKSGTATVTVPEFGATVTPGPYSEGYVSNVEGILDKIEDALTFMLASAKGKRLEKGEKLLKRIRASKESRPNFTLIMKDPLGNIAIVSPRPGKVRKRTLTKTELMKLKFGQYAHASKPNQICLSEQ